MFFVTKFSPSISDVRYSNSALDFMSKVFKSIIGDVFPKEDGTYELLETKCKDINFDRLILIVKSN